VLIGDEAMGLRVQALSFNESEKGGDQDSSGFFKYRSEPTVKRTN
jgi:hypothetical protein